MPAKYDAIVVGAGPNGLSAAIVLAREGLSVLLIEAKETVGGGARSAELTRRGFVHDICSAIHPMGVVSPLFQQLSLDVEWIHPPFALAHPFDDGSAAYLSRSLEETAESLGPDRDAWIDLMGPFVNEGEKLFPEILKPLRIPAHPLLMARFGLLGLQSCVRLMNTRFRGEKAPAIFAGCAAHSMRPLDRAATASFGLVLASVAHAAGWPLARGGSQSITDALATLFRSLGGEIRTSEPVTDTRQLPEARAVLFDLTPRLIAQIANEELPASYRRKLESFRYSPGIFKIDWALSGPVPWTADECCRAAAVHLAGTMDEIEECERAVWGGLHPERPFVLFAQQSLFDTTRAPLGMQTGWAYCHVPRGSTRDMTDVIERQVERFAPGFRELIIGRHTINSAQLEQHNPNMIGGDIGGGANDLWQVLARPVARWNPYATPNERLFICSSSTPPGGGVHGMCGYWAARTALRRVFS